LGPNGRESLHLILSYILKAVLWLTNIFFIQGLSFFAAGALVTKTLVICGFCSSCIKLPSVYWAIFENRTAALLDPFGL
jgi:hypothetical protein